MLWNDHRGDDSGSCKGVWAISTRRLYSCLISDKPEPCYSIISAVCKSIKDMANTPITIESLWIISVICGRVTSYYSMRRNFQLREHMSGEMAEDPTRTPHANLLIFEECRSTNCHEFLKVATKGCNIGCSVRNRFSIMEDILLAHLEDKRLRKSQGCLEKPGIELSKLWGVFVCEWGYAVSECSDTSSDQKPKGA